MLVVMNKPRRAGPCQNLSARFRRHPSMYKRQAKIRRRCGSKPRFSTARGRGQNSYVRRRDGDHAVGVREAGAPGHLWIGQVPRSRTIAGEALQGGDGRVVGKRHPNHRGASAGRRNPFRRTRIGAGAHLAAQRLSAARSALAFERIGAKYSRRPPSASRSAQAAREDILHPDRSARWIAAHGRGTEGLVAGDQPRVREALRQALHHERQPGGAADEKWRRASSGRAPLARPFAVELLHRGPARGLRKNCQRHTRHAAAQWIPSSSAASAERPGGAADPLFHLPRPQEQQRTLKRPQVVGA